MFPREIPFHIFLFGTIRCVKSDFSPFSMYINRNFHSDNTNNIRNELRRNYMPGQMHRLRWLRVSWYLRNCVVALRLPYEILADKYRRTSARRSSLPTQFPNITQSRNKGMDRCMAFSPDNAISFRKRHKYVPLSFVSLYLFSCTCFNINRMHLHATNYRRIYYNARSRKSGEIMD